MDLSARAQLVEPVDETITRNKTLPGGANHLGGWGNVCLPPRALPQYKPGATPGIWITLLVSAEGETPTHSFPRVRNQKERRFQRCYNCRVRFPGRCPRLRLKSAVGAKRVRSATDYFWDVGTPMGIKRRRRHDVSAHKKNAARETLAAYHDAGTWMKNYRFR